MDHDIDLLDPIFATGPVHDKLQELSQHLLNVHEWMNKRKMCERFLL